MGLSWAAWSRPLLIQALGEWHTGSCWPPLGPGLATLAAWEGPQARELAIASGLRPSRSKPQPSHLQNGSHDRRWLLPAGQGVGSEPWAAGATVTPEGPGPPPQAQRGAAVSGVPIWK